MTEENGTPTMGDPNPSARRIPRSTPPARAWVLAALVVSAASAAEASSPFGCRGGGGSSRRGTGACFLWPAGAANAATGRGGVDDESSQSTGRRRIRAAVFLGTSASTQCRLGRGLTTSRTVMRNSNADVNDEREGSGVGVGGGGEEGRTIHTISARFLDDNGMEIVTDEETGRVSARPSQVAATGEASSETAEDTATVKKGRRTRKDGGAGGAKFDKSTVRRREKGDVQRRGEKDRRRKTKASATANRDGEQSTTMPAKEASAAAPGGKTKQPAKKRVWETSAEEWNGDAKRGPIRMGRRVTKRPLREHPAPKIEGAVAAEFNVVLTHCTADFDTLASAVGLARLWSSPRGDDGGDGEKEEKDISRRDVASPSDGAPSPVQSMSTPATDQAAAGATATATRQFDDYDSRAIPTYVVLPRGAHPTVQRFLALHKHLFPIRSLRSLPPDLDRLNRLGLVDAQRRDRIGPAEHLLGYANRVTVVDHHVDSTSDIPEATDYVVDAVGSVSTMVAERLRRAGIDVSEAEATLLALGIHADTGSLCYDSATPRDAAALAWVMAKGASQAAIAEHSRGALSAEQQGVLTQALINTNSSVVHGVTVSTVLLSAEGFINGLAAVAQDALELSSSDVLLLSVVYDAKSGGRAKRDKRRRKAGGGADGGGGKGGRALHSFLLNDQSSPPSPPNSSTGGHIMEAGAWKGGEEALKRRRLRAAFDKGDTDGSGFLEREEISAALASSGVIASEDAVNTVMDDIDADGDGRVDFDEFVAFASQVEKKQKQQDELTGHRASTMIIIGRVKTGEKVKNVNLNKLFQQFGGGGHPKAASATVRLGDEGEAGNILQRLVDELTETSLLKQQTVGDFMTSPVLSAKPTMTEKQVEDLFTRYDVRALPVVDDDNNVIGLVTYKEVAAAKQRLFNKEQKRLRYDTEKGAESQRNASVVEGANDKSVSERRLGSALKGWMKQHVRLVEAGLTMAEAEAVLLENDVGCIPVVADGTKQLVGMVTRTDLLRQYRYYPSLHYHNKGFSDSIAARKPIIELRKRLKRFDLEGE